MDDFEGFFSSSFDHGLGQGVGQLIGSMAKNWTPSPTDNSNLELRKEEFKLREREFEMREQQFLRQMAETRNNLLLQLEAQRKNTEEQDLFRRWPLNLSPISILRESAKRNSYALNVIICIVDTNDERFLLGPGQAINQTIDMLNNRALPMAEQTAAMFENDMVCYRETLKKSKLTGDSLRTALSVSLASEPTVLIELRVPHADQVGLHICHWGLPSDTSLSFTKYKTQTLSLPSLPIQEKIDDPDARRTWEQQYQQISLRRNIKVGLALTGLIVAIGDAFRTLQRPHTLPAPILPCMMTDPTFGLLPEGSRVPEAMWQDLKGTYLSTYDGVGSLNKSLASELAAKAAYTAYEAKQVDFANQLLNKALQLNSRIISADEAQIMAILRRQRINNKPSELETALRIIRACGSDDVASEKMSSKSLEELARQYLGPSKNRS